VLTAGGGDSLGHLRDTPAQGPPSRFEVERLWLGYDALQWSSYAEFREAVDLEAEVEELVNTLVDIHLVFSNLPE